MSNSGTRVKLTVLAVLIFIVLFAWGLAKAEVRLGVGKGVTHDNEWTAQDVLLTNKDWYFQFTRLGGDELLPDTWRYSIGYRVEWREGSQVEPFLRLGVAYFDDVPYPVISEKYTFDMAVGVRAWRVVEFEWQHNSTAGRSDRNWGNDIFLLSVVLPLALP